jgi:dihydroorotate dehydrogenase
MGLRDLQSADFIRQVVHVVRDVAAGSRRQPVLVKLSPDLSLEDLKNSLDACLQAGVNGFILTNTTLARAPHLDFPQEGGVSGQPLAELSKQSLRSALQHLGADRKDLLIVSSGGILSSADVFERLEMGADLVQVYSALIFSGPRFFRQVAGAVSRRSQ